MCPTAAMTPRRLQGRRWAMMNAEVVLTWLFHMFLEDTPIDGGFFRRVKMMMIDLDFLRRAPFLILH